MELPAPFDLVTLDLLDHGWPYSRSVIVARRGPHAHQLQAAQPNRLDTVARELSRGPRRALGGLTYPAEAIGDFRASTAQNQCPGTPLARDQRLKRQESSGCSSGRSASVLGHIRCGLNGDQLRSAVASVASCLARMSAS